MLTRDNAALVVIDIQGKLAEIVQDPEALQANVLRLIRGAQLFDMPILWVEQYPEGLGRTSPPIAEQLKGVEVIEKTTFSAWRNPAFIDTLKATGRRQLLVAGIEAHVCVFQTVRDLLGDNYEVQVVADAVSSRTERNKVVGVDRMRSIGAEVTSTEMALFELMGEANGPEWKRFLGIVK